MVLNCICLNELADHDFLDLLEIFFTLLQFPESIFFSDALCTTVTGAPIVTYVLILQRESFG